MQLPPEKAKGSSKTSIDVTLEGDLVGAVEAGDRVTADVRLDLTEQEDGSTIFDFIAHGENLVKDESDFSDIEVSEEELDEIHDIANDTPFESIINSIAPSLMGLDTQKLAIGLQIFGGVEKTRRGRFDGAW